MSLITYKLYDSVFIYYDGGGEALCEARIDRSVFTRIINCLGSHCSAKEFIEETEELLDRVVYEGEEWVVPAWQIEFYKEELAEKSIDLSCVFRIVRRTHYMIDG